MLAKGCALFIGYQKGFQMSLPSRKIAKCGWYAYLLKPPHDQEDSVPSLYLRRDGTLQPTTGPDTDNSGYWDTEEECQAAVLAAGAILST